MIFRESQLRFLARIYTVALLGPAIVCSGANEEQPRPINDRSTRAVITHTTRGHFQNLAISRAAPQFAVQTNPSTLRTNSRTRSSFIATWAPLNGASGYRLDVSTSPRFDSYLEGYRDFDVGNHTGHAVTGLSEGTTYYYRARATGAKASTAQVQSAATMPAGGLIIRPTFDPTITSNPAAASIEAAINRAIAIYESFFTDRISVSILFRYSPNYAMGDPLGGISASEFVVYSVPWNAYIAALKGDGRTKNDYLANATLPGGAATANLGASSADGRAVGLDAPPAMYSNGSVADGGPYDGIVTLSSNERWRFVRPTVAGYYDAQRAVEHEIDEVLGLGSFIGQGRDWRPQDLFSWSGAGVRNVGPNGFRYFSIDGGRTDLIDFNQGPDGDFGDWLSPSCPQGASGYVQNAFACTGESSDVNVASYEAMNLDVIGYDLTGGAYSNRNDINGDGYADYVLFNSSTRQTALWYLDYANIRFGGVYGPTITAGWSLIDLADFNRDGHLDYALFNPNTRQTAIWYLSGGTFLAAAYGPTISPGWQLVAAADFNNDAKPDYLLYNPSTYQTAFWYMNNNVRTGGIYSATLSQYDQFIDVGDFSRVSSGYLGYLTFAPVNRYSSIWFHDANGIDNGGFTGPMIKSGYELAGAADFNRDGNLDYALFNPTTGQTAIWYLRDNSGSGRAIEYAYGAYGPTLPSGWLLLRP